MLFTRILARALYQDLRQKGGLSYQASANYTPRDRDHALVEVVADCLPEKREAVIGGVVDTIARLRLGTITWAELESARTAAMQQYDIPDWEAQAAPGYAINLLIGKDNLTREQADTEFCETTVEDIQRVAEECYSTALAQVPALGLDWAGFEQAPEQSDVRLTGREFASKNKDGSVLVAAPEGLSLTSSDNLVTIKYADVVAMQTYPDGARTLFGRDGFRIHLEPTIYPVDAATRQAIDTSVPAQAVISLPARDPADIPKPAPVSRATNRSLKPRGRPIDRLALVLTSVLAGFLFLVAVTATADLAKDRNDMTLGGVITCWIIFGVASFFTWFRWERWRGRR